MRGPGHASVCPASDSPRFGSSRAVFRRRCAAFQRSVCMLQFILDRAKEPSTYAGLATLLTAAGIHYTTDLFNAAVALAVAVAGPLGRVLPGQKAARADPPSFGFGPGLRGAFL